MVLPQRDPGPAGGSGAANGAAALSPLRRNHGTKEMVGKGVRIKFPQRPNLFVFPVNPRAITLDFPTRIAVTQTLASPYVDSLGKGLGGGQIAGTCGWGVPLEDPGQGITGLQRLLELKRLYEEWQNETVLRSTPTQTTCDLFLDMSQQLYQVVFNSLRIEHVEASPFTLAYTLAFQILHDYNAPVVVLPLSQLDQAGNPPNDGGSPVVQPEGGAR